ncbi:hypothetical protein K458DRAFT_398661 [Lentithecium fluviatile CBS 122367]|uniref:Uncharacterized protein n=1 Tax=Lentithecium fluviatile CBS 122367 TaxID=1168545 RepID=A0A6G1JKA0_9PLEO|nr:hypothetical protein K458DRAFT_398661 [Lentithecium fluviatile CBS 122367]
MKRVSSHKQGVTEPNRAALQGDATIHDRKRTESLSIHSRQVHALQRPALNAAATQPSISAVNVGGMIPKQSRLSSPRHGNGRQGKITNDDSRSHAQENEDTARSECKTLPEDEQTPSQPLQNAAAPSSDHDGAASHASIATRNAHAAMRNMFNRNLATNHALGISYKGRPTAVNAVTEDGFDTFADIDDFADNDADIESGNHRCHNSYNCRSNPRKPLLRCMALVSEQDSSGGVSPESYSSGDIPNIFYSPRQIRVRRTEEGREREWWDIDFDEWNVCLGVYLLGCIVVVIVGAAVVGIWILLHQ